MDVAPDRATVPPVRAGLIPRARLAKLLEAGAQGRLCLIDASAGSGRTTLLAQWCLADQASRRIAWVSLDDGEDDPVRFWVYVIEALRVVEPGLGEGALGLLQGSGAADVLTQVVLPSCSTSSAPRSLSWCWCLTTTTWSPTGCAMTASGSSSTTCRPTSTWWWPPGSTRRCPWPASRRRSATS